MAEGWRAVLFGATRGGRRRRLFALLLLGVWLTSIAPAAVTPSVAGSASAVPVATPLPAARATSDATLKTFDACLRSLRSTPYMRTRDDIDWEALAREWRPRADAAVPGAELRAVLNEMVSEVGASHAAVLSGPIYRSMMNELAGRPSPTFGVLLEEMVEGRLFVRALFEKGPGERAGLRIGDELVAVDGTAPLASEDVVDAGYDPGEESTRLFTLRAGGAGQSLALTLRMEARGELSTVPVVSEATSGLEAGRRSLRIVRSAGRRIGVIHLWMVARGSAELLAEALRGPLAKCDALVVDLRGRGGFADEIPGLLEPFRAAKLRGPVRGGVAWRKPVAFLIDDRTRSAKEILAWHVREERLGLLIGERTEGAVLGAGFFPLPGGHYLEAPMMEVPVADGTSLEGVGVHPTEAVRRAGPFARGRDPLQERALLRLVERLRGTALPRGPY